MDSSHQGGNLQIKSHEERQMMNMNGAEQLDQLAINTIRFLAVDAVQKANSGHPGAPMGAAAAAYILWDRFLKHHPNNPTWFDRDRFVLSAGHASMLLYGLLYMTGYDLTLDDLREFRQWGSKTPGHPEHGVTAGVEVTSGPLGQGFANGVGMAMAERFLAAKFNRPGMEIINHYTYALVSDGDLQEGLSYEAASLAGHLGLGKLIYLYDDNGVQIEGKTKLVFSENVVKRFEALNWQVIGPIDGYNLNDLEAAIRRGREEQFQPTLIICKTHIGYGSPAKQDQASAHGEPLGADEVITTKKNLGWPLEPDFLVPEEARAYTLKAVARGKAAEDSWNALLDTYAHKYPGEHALLMNLINGELPLGWDEGLDALFNQSETALATRSASGKILNFLSEKIPNLMGGSADLAPSNNTIMRNEGSFGPDNYAGRNIHFGVREHAMGSITNGLALHGGIIPYTGTFLVFSDYMRPSLRLAAMMGLRAIYIFSHDSIGLGEDGPTHQPIEHLTSLRAIPNLTVIRPADTFETIYAWRAALARKTGPTVLALTRQKLPALKNMAGACQGAYVIWEADSTPQAILLATGSEVHLALGAAIKLQSEKISVRVVSMPSWEIFDEQTNEYKEKILPSHIRPRIAIEAGVTAGWRKYVGLEGEVIGIDHFGASAPYQILYQKFGLTVDQIVARARKLLR